MDILKGRRTKENFVGNFEEFLFDGANPIERQLLVRKSISRIAIDRDEEVVRFRVNALSAVTCDVGSLVEKTKTEPIELMNSVCRGGRNSNELTLIIEIPFSDFLKKKR